MYLGHIHCKCIIVLKVRRVVEGDYVYVEISNVSHLVRVVYFTNLTWMVFTLKPFLLLYAFVFGILKLCVEIISSQYNSLGKMILTVHVQVYTMNVHFSYLAHHNFIRMLTLPTTSDKSV